ncbi:TonB-dependent receptor [Chitinasiproducens palmae]|uniref:Iron complex outermembrane recepter protein n=1 Tax=Chitinasiproducens palmae TaxID=1770053 RepID=A0A1H2PMN9_9BURK|nr:TonB-dependent siderophore receptor [Chitinasiproducens palmae]SDV47338.1 iron complex outermembrane recepter protein [Chitinasiproducens palmae]
MNHHQTPKRQGQRLFRRTALAQAVGRVTLGAAATLALPTFVHAQAASETATGADSAPLPQVEVKAAAATDGLPAGYAGGQVARGGGLGILGTSNTMDIPFSTTNYTQQALLDQQARTLADVVVNEASVRMLTSSNGFGEDFQIRGYTVSSTDVGLNGLYGMVSGSRMPAIMMERVEVLKGPGTLMYGIGPSGSIGGAVNIVTKRADDEPLTRLTATYQNKSQFGVQADVGRRYGKNNEWGIRFNGSYRNGDTTVNGGKQEQGVGAIGLDYRGERLRWSLDAYSVREDTDNFRPQVGFQSTIKTLPSPPSSYANFFPGTELKLRDSAVLTRLEYDITRAVTVYGAAGYHYGTAEQTFPSGPVDALGNFAARNAFYDSYNRTTTGEVGVRARFDTFGVGHTVSAAATRLDQESGNAYVTSAGTVPSNIYNPVALPPVTAARTSPQKASDTALTSFTITDTLSLANDRLLITAGLRHQNVALDNYSTTSGARTASYDQSAVSPLAGIVFKPLSNVSVYGNFTSGLTRGGVAPATAANAGEVFPPYKSKQYEAGVKVDWGRVMTSVSVFQITRPNAVTDPVTTIYSFDGEQRNRGLELAAYGEVTRGLRFMASTTFYDAKLTNTAGGANNGNTANGVPKYALNFGLDWDTPWVPGLGLNGRVITTSSEYFNATNTLQVPSYTRVDIGARYRTQVFGKAVVLRANVENLFNRNYWLISGTYATVSAPRTLLLSAQFDF